jgi:hypothetical protein
LDGLTEKDFVVSISDNRVSPWTVVLPTGRAADATSGHLALVSDALHVAEVVLAFDQISRSAGLYGAKVRTVFDIDYADALFRSRAQASLPDSDDAHELLNSNLLIMATADLNIITKLLLHETNSIDIYGVGFRKPYEDCIIVGAAGHTYAVMSYPNSGVLALYRQPWAEGKRVAVFCGGVLATGTLAATKVLMGYLTGMYHGNNSKNPNVPVRIVSSSMRDYHYVSLWPTARCTPQHELRNITDEILIHE